MKKLIIVLNLLLVMVLVGCAEEKEVTTINGVETEQDAGKVNNGMEDNNETVEETPVADKETAKENTSEKRTWKDIKNIVVKAVNSTGDYQAKCVITHKNYMHDREASAFDKDYTLIKDILFDAEKRMSYSKGTWENLVIDTWTGTTTSGAEEGYFYPGKYDGWDVMLSYEIGFDGTWYQGSWYDDFNSIATYYNDDAYFKIEEENETEYVISSYLLYSQILEYVGEFGIKKQKEIPIVYTIDKETNKLQHINWKFEYVDSSDLTIEMDMEISPMDDIDIVIPEEVISNSIDR